MTRDDSVTIASPEGPDFDIEVAGDLAELARSLMFGDFDFEAAVVETDHVTLSFSTIDGMDALIALCLRPSPDVLSGRIAGENEDGEKVDEPWQYTIHPNSIFITTESHEPNIVWSSSATFRRTDLDEVEARDAVDQSSSSSSWTSLGRQERERRNTGKGRARQKHCEKRSSNSSAASSTVLA